MPIITLTTDWGLRDHYVAATKGAILRQITDAQIIDISHQIQSFNILQASFTLKNCFEEFPEGSIHLIGVNSDASIDNPHTVVKHKNHYFIGADNGVFSLLIESAPQEIVEIDIPQDSDCFTFSTKDLFVKAAAHIAAGKPLNELGFRKDNIHSRIGFTPVTEGNILKGKVIYIDNYENAIVNVDRKMFSEFGQNRPFSIYVKSFGYELNALSESYQDVAEGEMLALFNSNNYLEIAINRGNASSLLGLDRDEIIRIEFKD